MNVQPLPLAISTLAVGLTTVLRDAQLPRWLNYAIMFSFFALSVLASVLTDGGFTGDPGQDLAIIITECAAIFALLESAMNAMSGVIPSPLGGIAANMAKKVEQQREFETWQASFKPPVQRASAPQPPQGGSVFAPPSNSAPTEKP